MPTLRPMAAADLDQVEGWFEDDETRHWLGGREWPRRSLELAGANHHVMLGLIDEVPVGLVDIETEADRRAGFAIVIAPEWRRRGAGRQIVETCLADARFAEVDEWFAGVETNNIASQQLLLRCGFARMTGEDADGFSYYALRRRGWPNLVWRPFFREGGLHPGPRVAKRKRPTAPLEC